jgi:putative ABC transport system ATP-binding protein
VSEALYEATSLAKHYGAAEGRVDALVGVDLRIEPGEFIAVIGPSGSGKSTLLNLLGLVARPSAGTLRFRGQDVATLGHARLAALRRQEIGFVFQSFQLLARTSALDNVQLPLVYANVPRGDREKRALAALDRVGLAGRVHHEPTQLSGGEQQRVAIARAIVNAPRVILADEPTGALDSHTGGNVLEMLLELNRAGTSVVVITHNPEVAAVAARRLQLADGRLDSAYPARSGGVVRGDPP